ncbi:MAG TPA: hypothetical protein VGM90_38240 [Kofleriaceae bacterium]
MAFFDDRFRVGVLAGGVALVAAMTFMRFCGSVAIPPKPAPAFPTGSQSQLLAKSSKTANVYAEYLAHDAAAAGVQVPSIDDMGRKFPYRVDDARHVLEVGQPAIELAGVKLALESSSGSLVLSITNTTDGDLAYSVVTAPVPNISECTSSQPIAQNALVIAKGATERRVECVYRNDMALAITRVESISVPPLSAWMLGLVPPSAIGLDPRTSRGHQGVKTTETCSANISQAVRAGLEKGQIGWRDLVDFYARHRCPTYRFPLSYKAFTSDNQYALPAVDSSM